MTPEEVGERMVALLTAAETDAPAEGEITAGVSGGGPGHERAVVDVPAARWWAALDAARDPGALGCDFFDWLSAVDELDEGFTVVAHLWSSRRKHGLLLRARLSRENPVVESVIDLFPGAAWHERETHEMFGISFSRHPDLRPLLLPPGFEGNPLRKEFVLASRVAKAWPGAKEPGESEAGTAKRAPMRPPGVPDPNEWGPMKGKVPPPETPARRAPGDRPARPAAGDRPVRAPGDRPARPASGDRPARPPREGAETPAAALTPPETPAAPDAPAASQTPVASQTPAETPAAETAAAAAAQVRADEAAAAKAPPVQAAAAESAASEAAATQAAAEKAAADETPAPETSGTPPETGTPPKTGGEDA